MFARPTVSALAALTVALLALSACSGDPEGAPASGSPSATSTEPTDPDALPAYDEGATVALGGLFKVLAIDGAMITFGGGPIIGLDTPAISERYSIEPVAGNNTDVALSEDKSTGYALSVSSKTGNGTSVGRDEITLTEFDPETGETTNDVVFDRERTSDDLPGRPLLANIRGLAGDLVVIDTRTDDLGEHAVSVLDLDTGRDAWTLPKQKVLAVTDDLVLTVDTSGAEPSVAAYDVATGDRLWRTLRGVSAVNFVGSTDDDAVLTWTQGEETSPQPMVGRVSLDKGKPKGKARKVTDSNWICYPGTPEVAVCQIGTGLTGWRLTDNTRAWALPTKNRYAPELRMVQDERVIGTLAESWVVLDAATGKDLASGIGSAPSVVNDTGGVFFDDGEAVWIPIVGEAPSSDEATPTIVP